METPEPSSPPKKDGLLKFTLADYRGAILSVIVTVVSLLISNIPALTSQVSQRLSANILSALKTYVIQGYSNYNAPAVLAFYLSFLAIAIFVNFSTPYFNRSFNRTIGFWHFLIIFIAWGWFTAHNSVYDPATKAFLKFNESVICSNIDPISHRRAQVSIISAKTLKDANKIIDNIGNDSSCLPQKTSN